jgi:3-dehydroquinate dehydratase-2
MKVLIINGPNLNLLGKRNPTVYGSESFESFLPSLQRDGLQLDYFQSNVEGELIDALHKTDAHAVVLNAGGYTHTSVALRDAVEAIATPVIEVHISNISQREPFRHESLISPVAKGCIFGFGLEGYQLAVDYVLNYLVLP